MATFFLCIKYALKFVTDMVLYNICDHIFVPRLIGTDSLYMEQICNSYFLLTITYMIQLCFAYLFQSGGRDPKEQILRFQLGLKEEQMAYRTSYAIC